MKPIAALFVLPDSYYKTLAGVDCYDAERNALSWSGGVPAIYHPPCRSWGMLKHFAKQPEGEHELGLWAVEKCRIWGGVVEHPMGSSLFKETGCNPAWGLPDQYGGRLICVDQFQWGHRARKRTLLYVVRAMLPAFPPTRYDRPQCMISGPAKVEGMGHRERSATPPAFADWLVEIARSV